MSVFNHLAEYSPHTAHARYNDCVRRIAIVEEMQRLDAINGKSADDIIDPRPKYLEMLRAQAEFAAAQFDLAQQDGGSMTRSGIDTGEEAA